jgi:hypothetical protein
MTSFKIHDQMSIQLNKSSGESKDEHKKKGNLTHYDSSELQ